MKTQEIKDILRILIQESNEAMERWEEQDEQIATIYRTEMQAYENVLRIICEKEFPTE